MKQWFRMQVAADDLAAADIYLLDIIGDWIDEWWTPGGGPGVITAKGFIEQLSKLPESVKTIRVHVSSPGGDVFAAVAMANALRDQRASKGRTVDVLIEGLAASAASIVIMAGNTIRISDNALVMVHNPLTFGLGNASEMRKIADELDVIRDTIVATYRWHSTLTDEELVALMDAVTWLDADEAVAKGFATEKVEGLKVAASLDRRSLAKLTVPEKYRARVEALIKPPETPLEPPAAAPADAVVAVCHQAGLDLAFAQALLAAHATPDQVHAQVEAETTRRADAETRAAQIRAVCAKALLPELAAGYIAGGMPLEAIRAQLMTLTAKLDQITIDGSLLPDHRAASTARLNAADIYAARTRLTTKE